jgi:hypothetical protein
MPTRWSALRPDRGHRPAVAGGSRLLHCTHAACLAGTKMKAWISVHSRTNAHSRPHGWGSALGFNRAVASSSGSNRCRPGSADAGERLGEIGDDVVDVLNADGGADGGIRDAKAFAGLPRHA